MLCSGCSDKEGCKHPQLTLSPQLLHLRTFLHTTWHLAYGSCPQNQGSIIIPNAKAVGGRDRRGALIPVARPCLCEGALTDGQPAAPLLSRLAGQEDTLIPEQDLEEWGYEVGAPRSPEGR